MTDSMCNKVTVAMIDISLLEEGFCNLPRQSHGSTSHLIKF